MLFRSALLRNSPLVLRMTIEAHTESKSQRAIVFPDERPTFKCLPACPTCRNSHAWRNSQFITNWHQISLLLFALPCPALDNRPLSSVVVDLINYEHCHQRQQVKSGSEAIKALRPHSHRLAFVLETHRHQHHNGEIPAPDSSCGDSPPLLLLRESEIERLHIKVSLVQIRELAG